MVQAERHAYTDALEAIEDAFTQGWSDGLPVIPATPERVQDFLDYVGLEPDEVLGTVPTREVSVTAEQATINAIMAGCRIDYMPVVIAAARAILAEKANIHVTSGTLAGAAHMVIVNGPVRNEIDVNCKAGCFGPGWRANATIGRSVRLMLRNVIHAIPGVLDRATYSQTARYTFCFGENEEDSPWVPLHVERGCPPGSSAVTVASVMHSTTARGMGAGMMFMRDPKDIVASVASAVRMRGVARDKWLEERPNFVLVFGLDQMRAIADAHWSKQDLREALFTKLQEPGNEYEHPVDMGDPNGILIVAAGGIGLPETHIFLPHLGWAITKEVERPQAKAKA